MSNGFSQARTDDLQVKSPLLYQLSYRGLYDGLIGMLPMGHFLNPNIPTVSKGAKRVTNSQITVWLTPPQASSFPV